MTVHRHAAGPLWFWEFGEVLESASNHHQRQQQQAAAAAQATQALLSAEECGLLRNTTAVHVPKGRNDVAKPPNLRSSSKFSSATEIKKFGSHPGATLSERSNTCRTVMVFCKRPKRESGSHAIAGMHNDAMVHHDVVGCQLPSGQGAMLLAGRHGCRNRRCGQCQSVSAALRSEHCSAISAAGIASQ